MTLRICLILTNLLVRAQYRVIGWPIRLTPYPVLQAIKLRYAQKEIYTYSGIVLIATNPFARVDSLYVPGMVQVYAGKQRASQAPHLFAIAEEAFA